jgi:hypothetical protein
MAIGKALIVVGTMLAPSAAFAADYRAEPGPRGYTSYYYARPAYVPYVPPVYYMPSPPQYVQDLRTGAPGHWVQLQPSFLDRLFGEPRDGY